MRFAVDPWDPTYGTSLDVEPGTETGAEPSSAEIDVAVEVPEAAWAPVGHGSGVVLPETVLFVDGVRRVDAQIWVDEPDGVASPALCASYAAGVVCCRAGEVAHLSTSLVRRALVTTRADAEDVVTTAGRYRASVTAERADTAPMQVLSLALQRELAEVELVAAGTARDALPGGSDLLVVDGPLRGRQHLPRVLGFVKSHRSEYLPAPLGAVVSRLRAGERTPVFRVGTSWSRYTWYLRLPCAPGAPWAGVVRVECGAELPAADAITMATLSQAVLPRYASVEYKDSRAPQNLYPIAGLERALRRRLGEVPVLYRALRRAAAGPAVPVSAGRPAGSPGLGG
ncbi:hypothetical protein EV383_3604 [Pseudonocardia sediminis]|uniref:NurA domain-containing protein n=1 Tax=Pseudonocardia sediminis TaxID=1397368 RepID=A0A4Q7UXC0_PSEST|nr:hypothetical protein [Pseudonocardia sediminis]RZT86707.1 hypothetical protein EV383_3604 [Pseudonocardia sediminis]